jgi:hypothetical protein
MATTKVPERTDEERLIDDALLLCLWARAQERAKSDSVGDRLKLMKLAFLPAYQFFRERTRALSLKFFRYTHGPYSKEVSEVWDDLEASDLMVEVELFTVTASGRTLADDFYREVLALPENEPIRAVFDEVVNGYATFETSALLAAIYRLPCYTLQHPDMARPIGKIRRREDFTRPLRTDEAERTLSVPLEWRSTLELVFHPEAQSNLRRGVKDARSGRLLTSEGMWGRV